LSYDASAIQVLEGLDAVRKRPGMYIGSTGERGLHHLVYEVVDNSVDEAMAGYATHIQVRLLTDGGVQVTDDGRGIPVDEHPVEKKPAVEVVLTTLHAGGKFGGSGYQVSGGLHGVGVSVVNALSTKLEVEVRREGSFWNQTYLHGVPQAALKKGKAATDTGTMVTFWADSNIFETTNYTFETLAARFREMAFLNKGMRITLVDDRELIDDQPRMVDYKYDDGLIDFVKHIAKAKSDTPIHKDVLHFSSEDKKKGYMAEIALQWVSSYSESVYTFANTINTQEGGTHEEGFRTALTSLINKAARNWSLLKEKDINLTGEDIREGLIAIVSVKLHEPQFEGQTKTKLGNTEIKSFVQSVLNEEFGAWLESHPTEGKEIARKSISAASARIAARKARDLARSRKGLLGSSGLPGKLSDCQSTNPEDCELFIVEGDSAGGSTKTARDSRTQAILPIRGKILNVEKARIDRVLQNNEVQALISALGTGVHDDFDLAKLRYHKIVLMADADVDGQHIRTLLLTLLFRFMKPLVAEGYVYLAQPPLFKLKWAREAPEYVYSDRERDALIELGKTNGKKLPKDDAIQRYKGLGEMNADELWDTTMDPQKRVLLQVTMDDAAAADALFSILMGEDVESRRSFIQHNARDVRFLDI
jgi:DNA gyrase subunit B